MNIFKQEKGFSVAELLIYVGILTISVGVLSGILRTVTQTQVEEATQNEISGQLNFAIQTIQRIVRESSYIAMSPGVSGSTLLLKMPDTSQEAGSYTSIYLQNGKIYVQEEGEVAQTITSENVTVDSLAFTKFTQYPAQDIVQIDIAISGVEQVSGKTITRALRSAISRASAVTFDSDLLPGATDSYDVGNSGNKWRYANFSQNVTIDGTVNASELCISGDCITSWGSTGLSGSGTSGRLAKWTSASSLGDSVIYEDSGNIGIGVAGPGARLQINTSGASNKGLIVKGSASQSANIQEWQDSSGSVLAVIDANGDVGIGASSPATKLEIENSSDEILRLTRNGGSNPTKFSQGTDDALVINNGGSDMLTIKSGYVGIGTTDPAAKLEVKEGTLLGANQGDNQLITRTSGITGNVFMNNVWLYRDAAGLGWETARLHDGISVDVSFLTPGSNTRVWWERDPNNLIQSWGSGSNTWLTISNGKVGIGTTTPSEALEVNGDIYVANGQDVCIYGGNCLSTAGGGGVSGSGAAAHIAYWSGSNSLTYDSGQLYWDATDNQLMIGTTTAPASITDPALIVNGPIYMGESGQRIRNVATPVSNSDAATKAYVDAVAGKPVWAGYTGSSYDGNFGGIKGANEKCEAAYSGSHWASAQEIAELGSDYPWTTTTDYHVWVRNGIVNGSDFQNFRDFNGDNVTFMNTCSGYTTNSSSYYGVTMTATSNSGYLGYTRCDISKRLACVY